MPEHNFTLVISGPAEDKLDELFEAGCDDAMFGVVDGAPYAEFDREAPTLREAVASAIRDIESVENLRVDRIEPDDLVTASEIAERLGRTRESVRLLISGERGPGGFPAPVSHLRDRNRLWRWTDVARWAGRVEKEQLYDAVFMAAMNAVLEWRRQRGHLEDRDREIVEELVPC